MQMAMSYVNQTLVACVSQFLLGSAQGSIHGIDRECESCLGEEESWGVLTGPLLQLVTM